MITNSTESLNIAIKGLLNPGDHVITTVLEHNSVLRPLYEMQACGVELTILPCNTLGMVDYDDFEEVIQVNTKAIICTHASNLTGNLLNLKEIGSITKKHSLLFIVDASQTAGVFDIDVQDMNIDVLCFTGHKGLLGPQGTGGIYVREGLDNRPLNGDFSLKERCAIVTLNIGDYDSSVVGDELYMTYGIAVRSGAHCAPRYIEDKEGLKL